LLIAVSAVAFAVVVAFALRNGTPESEPVLPVTTDPTALVESASGTAIRVNRDEEQVRIKYDRLLTYEDGSTRFIGVEVITEQSSGRTFTLRADEGRVGQRDTEFEFSGDVLLTNTGGLIATSDHATYREQDGTVRAPGHVEFSRGRVSGAGFGMAYNKNADLLTILRQGVVKVASDRTGSVGLEVNSESVVLSRSQRFIRFEGGMHAVTGGRVIESDLGIGHFDDSEERLETLELLGNASIVAADVEVGGLEALTGHDIDLSLGSDGQTLETARVRGDAVMRVASGSEAAGRLITADTLDVTLGSDGSTPTALTGRQNVVVNLPAVGAGVSRTIRARTLDAAGDETDGLTAATFEGGVQFHETGPQVDRSARSEVLEAALAPGLGDIEEARFSRDARFVDGGLIGTAAVARYGIRTDTLELSGLGPKADRPRVVNERLSVSATRIDVTLADGDSSEAETGRSSLVATGSVTSELRPGNGGESKTPSMLSSERPVIIVGDELHYEEALGAAVYTGNAHLSQLNTSVKGDSITLQERTGDLMADGSVVTTTMIWNDVSNGEREQVTTTARSSAFVYTEETRVATYTGDARVSGPLGDLQAERVELFLTASGDELECVEAYESVTLLEHGRTTTGERLTYVGETGQYVVVGTPVRAVDACGRETTGRTLTFNREADRLIVDGTKQVRTRTQGAAECP
jgi:LPS export ABC transporter protein LptC